MFVLFWWLFTCLFACLFSLSVCLFVCLFPLGIAACLWFLLWKVLLVFPLSTLSLCANERVRGGMGVRERRGVEIEKTYKITTGYTGYTGYCTPSDLFFALRCYLAGSESSRWNSWTLNLS